LTETGAVNVTFKLKIFQVTVKSIGNHLVEPWVLKQVVEISADNGIGIVKRGMSKTVAVEYGTKITLNVKLLCFRELIPPNYVGYRYLYGY